jgi:hypothetical protein
LWVFLSGKMQVVYHILTDNTWHSMILNVWPFRGADCDTDHYLQLRHIGRNSIIRWP